MVDLDDIANRLALELGANPVSHWRALIVAALRLAYDAGARGPRG
jgi:hypothetical protein